ncbi:YgaP family membrane protein [Pseudoalteromonas sp. SSDWG2]|uniref:YgaP family membrane protein n=1 Tax=Pseudoalteromonas sp. SSDWG2 TaxID=3139391 RepID=UPI003BA9BCAE
MRINAALRLIAGIMILLSLLLTYMGGPMWLWFTAFIALNLIQSAFSGWCPMISILRKLGMEE